MVSEEQLIKGCVRGDRKYQKLLYERYASAMLGVCIRYSSSRPEAEDIVQEGFLKIFLNIKDFTGKGSFVGWMRRIMVNTAITFYHKNLKHNQLCDINGINESDIENPSPYEEDEFSHEELLKIINELPAGYKMVFNLFAIEGYKHKDIAEILNIDVNTSKSQYSRARKLIQKKLLDLKNVNKP